MTLPRHCGHPGRVAGAVALAALCIGPAHAYPEYQAWAQKNSGRFVNCAMCHAHPDGPEGVKPGQIGSLPTAQLAKLGEARRAFTPGTKAHSPILNEFGNDILAQLGRTEIIALRRNPGELAGKLSPTHDIDGDGIPDAVELPEGTDPLSAQSGNPWQLFKINLVRQRFHILMIALATACALYGLKHLLHGLHRLAPRERSRGPARHP